MRTADAETLCKKLMAEHGLAHWNFTWINSNRCFGQCDYLNRAIILSLPLVAANNVENVTNVILHEIAHALAGRMAKHGPLWVSVAKRIGCNGQRCFTWNEVSQPKRTGGYAGACDCGSTEHWRRYRPGPQPHFCKKCNHRIAFIKQ